MDSGSTQTAQTTQGVAPQVAGQQRDFQNISFSSDSENSEEYIPSLMVLGTFGGVVDTPKGNIWCLDLTCTPPLRLNEQPTRQRIVRIYASPDRSRPRHGGVYFAETHVTIMDYYAAPTDESKFEKRISLPIWTHPGFESSHGLPITNIVENYFPVGDILRVMGSIGLDTFVFDGLAGGNHSWFWILACALGKHRLLNVTQRRWDELFDLVWTKWPEGTLYDPDSPDPENCDAGPNWTPTVRLAVISSVNTMLPAPE